MHHHCLAMSTIFYTWKPPPNTTQFNFGQCQQANVIYGASIKTLDILGEPVDASEETYTGTSYPPWKIRLYGHNTTFNNPALRHKTTLADYIWDLQCPDKCFERGEEECDQRIDYDITWRILARAPGYNPVTGMCRLCLKESFFILFHPETASLNKKNEIYQGCKHKHFKFLEDCKVTWNSKFNPLDPFTFLLLSMFHN